MAKTKTLRRSAPQAKAGTSALQEFDLDVFLHKYIWLLIPILVLVYYWFSTQSTGFYQDDEIGHYRNMRQFWGDPFSIMGNQPKPGWKILFAIPALFGFSGVLFANCLFAAGTVVATYFLGRALGFRNSFVAALLLALQPLWLQLAFRSYSEIPAGLFTVLMVLFFVRKQYIWAAITSSYIFSIRQEFALISIALGVLFLMKKQWIPFLLLGWTPVVLALIGWMHTGNAMWLLEDMQRIGLNVQVPHRSFWHYWETYIYIIGPLCLTLFLVGYWSFLAKPAEWKEDLKKHGFLFFTFTVIWAWSVISAWDVPNFGANPGHWRYVLSISPLAAVYAGKGIGVLFDPAKRKYAFTVLIGFALITLLFLSREANGLTMTDVASYDNFLMVLLMVGLAALLSFRVLPGKVFLPVVVLAAAAFTLYAEKPRMLDSEATIMKQAAEWYAAKPDLHNRPLYCNHVLFKYFADIDITDKKRDVPMQKETLAKAPKGSIIVWESHYGNSQFGGDVPMEYFKDNPDYTLLDQIIAPDQRFGALIFEKTIAR